MAGAYAYLPLGLRVLKKIENIIREEMNAIGGQELSMTALQAPKVWEATGRWSDEAIDVWFKTSLKDGGELGLAATHEEPITALMLEYVSSYKDLPLYVYQFQSKFRNELRAKSGVMRTREFVMKDLYSFNKSEEEFREFYEKCATAYLKIFSRAGLGDITYRTFASGGSFSKYSDEFQTISSAGEDTIYVHKGRNIAVNKEVYTDEVLTDLKLEKSELEEVKAIEVGNIFPLGSRFSDALGLRYKNESGELKAPIMGSYGIGPGRLMGTIVETLSDKKGIVWPKEVAPFAVHLVSITGGNADVQTEAERVYELLREHGIETLYDDRDARAGEKFADADLIGIPLRMVVSEKMLQQGGIEITERATGAASFVPDSGILEYFHR